MQRHRQELLERNEDPDASPANAIWRGSEAEATEVTVYHAAILRNKRLLMAYTYVYFLYIIIKPIYILMIYYISLYK